MALCGEHLKRGAGDERKVALMVLLDLREAAAPALPSVLAASHDPDEEIRAGAARALAALDRSQATLARLVEMLRDESAAVRSNAADAVGAFGPTAAGAVPLLAEMALDPEEIVSRMAVSALGKIHSRPDIAVPALIRAMKETQTLGAIDALADFGREARPAVPALVELVRERAQKGEANDWLGHEAALALAKIAVPEVKAALPALETLHGRMTSDNWKQDVADAIYKIKAMNGGGPH